MQNICNYFKDHKVQDPQHTKNKNKKCSNICLRSLTCKYANIGPHNISLIKAQLLVYTTLIRAICHQRTNHVH